MNIYLRALIMVFTFVYFFSSTLAPVLAAMTYTYDNNGNMTSDGTKCYEYNDANQMKRVKYCSNNEPIADYVYDYTGKRIVKKQYQNGDLQKTVISPDDEFEIMKLASNSAKFNTTYYYTNDKLISKKDPYGTRTYYHNDHLGSASLITNQSGVVVEETKYDPWGEVKSGGEKSKFQYTGQEKDDETSLNYYNARYYDPHLRRFTQPDDIVENVYDPQMLNRYAYVRNNPLRYTDPTGHFLFAIPVTYWLVGLAVAAYFATPQVQKTVVKPLVTAAAQQLSNIYNSAKNIVSTYTNKPSAPPQNTTTTSGGQNGGNPKVEQPKVESPKLKYDNPNRNPAQDRKVPDSLIKKIEKQLDEGDIHSEKGKRGSKYDIYNDKDGNLYKKPKGGKGYGDALNRNLKEFNF